MKQKTQSPAISRSAKSSDFATMRRQGKKRRKPLAAIANWPLSVYEPADRADLLQLKPQEIQLLSEVGQKALTVLLRSHLDQDSIGHDLDRRHIPPALREKMKGLIQRTQKLAKDAPSNSVLQKQCQLQADLLIEQLTGPKPIGGRVSSMKFRKCIAWPFFQPALTYAVSEVFRRASNLQLTKKTIVAAVDSVMHGMLRQPETTSRAIRRFRQNKTRLREMNVLIIALLNKPR
ncbi:MAG TPA: hypothetical protein VOA64_02445 [Candidatus Dormibacteraeota bacterium]|nr:hypothetical protein [Candidatus Dormibacteraeota bacterium]